MLYLLDTANVKEIEKAAEVFPLAGVTTNPSIIAQEKRSFFTILKEIRAIIGDRMLHAQVLGETCEDIIRDAETLQEKIGGNLYIKVPVSIEGYKAMPKLKQMGMKVTATAIYTPGQALLAAQAGVDFTAPYLNRIDNISGMGVTVVQAPQHVRAGAGRLLQERPAGQRRLARRLPGDHHQSGHSLAPRRASADRHEHRTVQPRLDRRLRRG